MIFCFVRETKQLTLEEIDRECYTMPDPSGPLANTNIYRGLFGPNQRVSPPRVDRMASILHQATYLPPENPKATTNYREGRESRRCQRRIKGMEMPTQLVTIEPERMKWFTDGWFVSLGYHSAFRSQIFFQGST